MRDNISIIFAILIGVVILIIFPLFSVMSRQDSISYNRVLTLTTEFVDSVRTKGYVTQEDYTEYLVDLANTNNTYNVQLEYHDKILINDINNDAENPDENPLYVEDTLIYYNKDILNKMESNGGTLSLKEDDEFYVKVYNTNITTASLLYNFFARVSIPPKVINIGYGGKVSHITGVEYTKTDFSNSYTPYIKLGDAVNTAGEINETCYDSNAGTYDIKTCIRLFNLGNIENRTVTIPFELHNFSKIYEDLGAQINVVEVSDLEDPESNEFHNVSNALVNLISLRGIGFEETDEDYAEKQYQVTVDKNKLEYANGVITGQIKISNINLPDGVSTRTSNIVIGQGLGVGPTGIVSGEGKSHEILFTRVILYPEFQLYGPFKEQVISNTVESTFEPEQTAYFKVKMIDYESEYEIKLIDLDRNEVIPEGEYTLNFVEETANKEFWLKLTYYSLFDRNLTLEITTKKPVDNATDQNLTYDHVVQSNDFKYEKVPVTQNISFYTDRYQGDSLGAGIIRARVNSTADIDDIWEKSFNETQRFMEQTMKNIEKIQVIYATTPSLAYNLSYECRINNYKLENNKYWRQERSLNSENYNYMVRDTRGKTLMIEFTIIMKLASTTEMFREATSIKLVMNNMDNQQIVSTNMNIDLRGLKLPEGFIYKQYYTYEDLPIINRFGVTSGIVITDIVNNRDFLWVDKSDFSIPGNYGVVNCHPIYEETYDEMIKSMEQYGGYFISIEPIEFLNGEIYNNGREYQQAAWANSIRQYNTNPDIISHMAYWQQIRTAYNKTWDDKDILVANNYKSDGTGTVFYWGNSGSGNYRYILSLYLKPTE